jgi:hypothetical protein
MPALAALLLLLPASGCHRALISSSPDASGPVGIDASPEVTADVAVDAVAAEVARDAVGDVIVTADGDAGGGLPCGAGLTCYGTDLCITLNLCGGPMRCDALPDGGQCPAGSTFNSSCPGGPPGCVPNCPGPSYLCKPRPAACAAAVDCSCLDFSFCPSSGCVHAEGRAVFCANE